VNSELEILRSHDVLDPVADPAWEKLPANQRDASAIRRHEALLAAFDKRLEVEPVRKTNVISVSLRARDPEEARKSLQHLSDAYLEQHRRMERPAGASSFFAAEAERYRSAWNEASHELVDFQQEHQLFSLQQRETDIEGKINSAQGDLLTAEASLKELDARLAESAQRMHAMANRQTTQDKAQPNLQSMQQLTTMVTDLENRRTVLLTNYKAGDRLVRELDQQIAFTKAQLNDATTVKSHEVTTDIDPLWQQLRTAYAEADIGRRAAAARRAAVAAQLATLNQNLAGLQELDVRFNNLEEQVKERKENFELYAEKRDQSQIADEMDEQGLMNVVVAQQPTWSYQPARPKPLINALLGAVTALFLGFCAVYVAEAGRNTVATPRELDAASRYPVLATLSVGCGRVVRGDEGTVINRERVLQYVTVHTSRAPDLCSSR
jgi:succinoglycan biosynthesis transport protein ExoP